MENSFLMVKLGSHLMFRTPAFYLQFIYSKHNLPPTPDNKIMKTSFPVFLSIMVDICFFSGGRNCPSIRKGRRNPNYMPAMLSGGPHSLWMIVMSGSEIPICFHLFLDDNYVGQFVCNYFVPSDKCELHALVLDKYMR